MQHPRQIDEPLVDAYLARRALDYLVGFTLSPVLWRKLPGARSAGRVQSVALRLVCDRESEIELFKPQEYWSVEVTLEPPNGGRFVARVVGFDGKKLGRLDIPDEATARRIEAALEAGAYRVASVEAKPAKRNPPPPFTTSTLQQEASRKLGFAAARTMQIAQRLYEDGAASPTCGPTASQMAPEAIAAARRAIANEFGDRYLPEQPRLYQTKAKNAQEAHEAIRPTDLFAPPGHRSRASLDADQARLYELIWKRTLASQMAVGRARAHHRRHRRRRRRAAGRAPRHRPGRHASTASSPLYQEGRDDGRSSDEDEDGRAAAAGRRRHARLEHGIADRAALHRSRRRATPRRR